MLRLAVGGKRLLVVVEFEHDVVASVVLAQRVEVVALLLGAHLTGKRQHGLLELFALAFGDVEFGDYGNHELLLSGLGFDEARRIATPCTETN